jgi:hypothetical protein
VRSGLFPQPSLAPFTTTLEQDTIIRAAYHGGTSFLINHYAKDVFSFDINSLYPFLKIQPLYIGKPTYVPAEKLPPYQIRGFLGLVCATVTVPEELPHPLLLRSLYQDGERRSKIGQGTFTGLFYAEELDYALTLGYTCEVLYGLQFTRKEVTKTFVDHFYALKQSQTNDPAQRQLTKLFLNSLFGKLSQKPLETQSYNELVRAFAVYSGNVTARARILKHKVIKAFPNLISYSDTDSIYLNKDLRLLSTSEKTILCKALGLNELVGPRLGSFKKETFSTEAFFFAPKRYLLRSEHNHFTFKAAGLNQSYYNQPHSFKFLPIYTPSSIHLSPFPPSSTYDPQLSIDHFALSSTTTLFLSPLQITSR